MVNVELKDVPNIMTNFFSLKSGFIWLRFRPSDVAKTKMLLSDLIANARETSALDEWHPVEQKTFKEATCQIKS